MKGWQMRFNSVARKCCFSIAAILAIGAIYLLYCSADPLRLNRATLVELTADIGQIETLLTEKCPHNLTAFRYVQAGKDVIFEPRNGIPITSAEMLEQVKVIARRHFELARRSCLSIGV
jgi:hypothetical protein